LFALLSFKVSASILVLTGGYIQTESTEDVGKSIRHFTDCEQANIFEEYIEEGEEEDLDAQDVFERGEGFFRHGCGGLLASAALRVRGGLGGADGGSGEDEDGSMAELLASLPAPTALVRESSTLFRRVSSATMVKYEQRKFDHSSGDRLLMHSAGGADDSSSNMSTDDGIELGLEAAAAAAAITPQSIELSMREIELENLRQRTRAALSSIRVECGVDLAKPVPRADAAAGPPSEAAAAVAAAAVADATAAALTCGRSSSVADSSDGVRRDTPYWTLDFDFVLHPAAAGAPARPEETPT
jgi:hypothetical protein